MLYSFKLINGKTYIVDAVNFTAAPPSWASWNGEYYEADGLKYFPVEIPSAWDGEDVLTYDTVGYASDRTEAENLNKLLYDKNLEIQKIILSLKGEN